MDHVENDMDDLFQKASELYPLNTGNHDWDSVLVKLDSGIDHEAIVLVNEKVIPSKRKRRWLLLLIPFALTSYFIFNSHVENNGSKKLATAGETINRISRKTINDPANLSPIKDNTSNMSATHLMDLNKFPIEKTGTTFKEHHHKSKSPLAGDGWSMSNRVSNKELYYPSGQIVFYPDEKWKPVSLKPDDFFSKPQVKGSPLPVRSADFNITAGLNHSKNKKTKKEQYINQHFYVGFVAGPDVSNVHFQQVSQTGFSLGIIAGYRFTKCISFETGLYWDKKFYYSEGSYFKPTKGMPAYVNVSQVKGNCNMFELPIAIRYDFATKNNHGFFAKAGLSSYFMQKENYNIEGTISRSGWPNQYFDSDTSYARSSSNIFSIIQFSVGYEKSIGKNTKIRVEPYVKIPTQGIGYGNLPVSSAGLLLGFSYSFR